MIKHFSILLMCIFVQLAVGQDTIRGRVLDSDSRAVIENAVVRIPYEKSDVLTNKDGKFSITSESVGQVELVISAVGYAPDTFKIDVNSRKRNQTFTLIPDYQMLDEFSVQIDEFDVNSHYLKQVEHTAIYAGKKTDLIHVQKMAANKAMANPRELYKQVAGLNIWESDGAGIQLGIGGRGLSPDRTSNFNVRQNGYDISADALGYPESYYTPPAEVIKRIEVIRGAASLQYGTQFGGLVNFKLVEPVPRKKIGVLTKFTGGSNSFLSNYTYLGGSHRANKYSGYVKYSQGDDFRPNSAFEQLHAYMSYRRQLNERSYINFEYTHMSYLAQQPGGLTDEEFLETPYASYRDRNWFKVNWNLAAINYRVAWNNRTKGDLRLFGLKAQRMSLGDLTRPDREDPGQERTLINGQFNNVGLEGRLLRYFGNIQKPHVGLVGFRAYKGRSTARQGAASSGSDADFNYIRSDSLDSDYVFPSYNGALFAETIFNVSEKLSITPGARAEIISTEADGFYRLTYKDLAGNVIEQVTVSESQERVRSLALLGVGVSYDAKEWLECYANASQNYRAITFNDMRIVNPNFRIDTNLTDERGYTADLGIRGSLTRVIRFDLSAFYLYYANRIGLISQVDPVLNTVYMLRTNVAASRNQGVEGFVQWHVIETFNDSTKWDLDVFVNAAYIDARYINEENPTIHDNRVEHAPEYTLKSGVNLIKGAFQFAWQVSYTSLQYTDATNAEFTSSGINGIISSYTVQDVAANYTYKNWKLELGVNNLLDETYFTRRASGYPGPGILPSAGRTFYVSLQLKTF